MSHQGYYRNSWQTGVYNELSREPKTRRFCRIWKLVSLPKKGLIVCLIAFSHQDQMKTCVLQIMIWYCTQAAHKILRGKTRTKIRGCLICFAKTVPEVCRKMTEEQILVPQQSYSKKENGIAFAYYLFLLLFFNMDRTSQFNDIFLFHKTCPIQISRVGLNFLFD